MQKVKKHISNQYIGRQSYAVVQLGDNVNAGSVIAKSSDRTSNIYSTASGKVCKITQSAILLEYDVVVDIPEEPKPKITPSAQSTTRTDQIKKPTENTIKEDTTHNVEKKQKKFNVDALDGLRTLAIVSVIFYHLGFGWLKGGLLGVTIFFVLSGYLITGILKTEIENTGKVDLKTFWIHRIRRLFPAIVCVICVIAILCILFNHILLTKMKPDIIPSLVWFQNWWYIIRGLSYFDNLGSPSPLIHFWSLAIEEQFYLFWPLILLGAYKLGANHKIIRRICLGLAIASALAMVIMYQPDTDPTRVYYGTDTRAFSLLIGAFLAYIWPWQKLQNLEIKLDSKKTKMFDIGGIAALISLILIMIFIDGMSPAMYYGVLFLVSVLAAVIIAVLVVPNTKLGLVFALKPMAWIGKRSYGMYLWHFPLILLLKPINGDVTNVWWFAVLIIALTLIISAVQYKFIENPIRRGFLSKRYHEIKERKFKLKSIEIIIGAICAGVIAFTIIGTIVTPEEYLVPKEEINSTGDHVEHAMVVEGQYYPLLVADSVTGSIKLQNFFPYALNDSVVGRWTKQAVNVLKEYRDKGTMSNIVIVSCFSNHVIGKNDLNNMLDIVGQERELFLVTPYLLHDACAINNKALSDFASQHNNVHLIDWYSAVAPNPDAYLYKDHVHPTTEGQKLYVKLLAEAINDYLPDNAKCDISQIPANIKKK